MARIDIETLVRAFESRIEALEKNPPDKIKMSVIVNLLEKAITDEIQGHFVHVVEKELRAFVSTEYKAMYKKLIQSTVKELLTDSNFKEKVRNRVMLRMVAAI